jgi:hypothetical protein
VAIAEMCIASGLGAAVRLAEGVMFREMPGCYVVEHDPRDGEELKGWFDSLRLTFEACGEVIGEGVLRVDDYRGSGGEVGVAEMTGVWRGTLDW